MHVPPDTLANPMVTGGGIARSTTAGGLAALALAAGIAGCGGSSSTSTARTPARTAPPQVAPISDLELVTGTPQHQITATIVSFYRAAWHDDAARACSLFSPAGLAGFMRAARVAFPGSITRYSTCVDAMRVFNAGLVDSVNTLVQQQGVPVSGAVLDHVAVQDLRVIGNFATVIAPVGIEPIIKPKRISLVRERGRWLIAGSHSLTTTIAQMLAEARAKGELTPAKKR